MQITKTEIRRLYSNEEKTIHNSDCAVHGLYDDTRVVFQIETAWAAGPSNLTVDNATYYANGALKSIEASFGWGGATDVEVQLVLMEKKLNGGESYSDYGDFTDCGHYGRNFKFKSYEDIKAHDEATGAFGLIKSSTLQPYQGVRLIEVLNLDDTDIPLNENKYYYVYIWTLWGSLYYPDHLVCAISVQDGIVKYAPADGKGYNAYDENKLDAVTSETAYNVTVNPGKGMTRDENSGSESQPNLNKGMTPVVYTANPGYHFPEAYTVENVNGIMVRRDNATQITVYGTPSANATINLNAATEGNPPAENTAVKPTAKTGLKYDGKIRRRI